MAETTLANEPATLDVENVGGIAETTVTFEPGVTLLTGRNATNRTSLLQAVMAALGSDEATIKGDAESARVELTIGETTYTRTFERRDGTVVTGGDPYLADATVADLFAFLLETNDARRAVTRGVDLRDLIMEPIDTAEIEGEIDRLQSRRDEIDDELEEIDQLKRHLTQLEEDRSELRREIAEKREEKSDIEDEIEEIDGDVDGERDDGDEDEVEEALDELDEVRRRLETVRQELDTQRQSLDALADERAELRSEREAYEDLPEDRLEGVEAEIRRLRERKSDVRNAIDQLQVVIGFNEDLLDGSLDAFADLRDEDEGAVTDELLGDGEDLVCPTCGAETDSSRIEETVDRLRTLRSEYVDRRDDLDDRVDDLERERRELEEKRRQRDQIDDQLETIEAEIEDRRARVEELTAREEELAPEVERLEAEVESLRADDGRESEVLALHKEANRLDVRIERLEADLADLEAEVDRVEDRIADRDDIEARRAEIRAEIEDLRTRVERLEGDAVEEFNDHMAAVLDRLGYENIERVWIERTEETVPEGRRTATRGRFDLHVVRSTDDGTVYEDTVDHLSESEREVVGLVFALAGYLVHDVYEAVPFMLLDSVEAIDAPRIADLVEYFAEFADYLVVALLEEDARPLDEDYRYVSDI